MKISNTTQVEAIREIKSYINEHPLSKTSLSFLQELIKQFKKLDKRCSVQDLTLDQNTFQICLNYDDNFFVIDVYPDVYFKLQFDNYEFTYMFENLYSNESIGRLLTAFFVGNYQIEIFGRDSYAINWRDTELVDFNQKIQKSILKYIGLKPSTKLTEIKEGVNLYA